MGRTLLASAMAASCHRCSGAGKVPHVIPAACAAVCLPRNQEWPAVSHGGSDATEVARIRRWVGLCGILRLCGGCCFVAIRPPSLTLRGPTGTAVLVLEIMPLGKHRRLSCRVAAQGLLQTGVSDS